LQRKPFPYPASLQGWERNGSNLLLRANNFWAPQKDIQQWYIHVLN
jgi:hypothetical protein